MSTTAAREERLAGVSRVVGHDWRWPAALLVAVVFLALFYGEARYRSCIQRVEAQYPAVPVSAFNQRDTGALKVSYVAERNGALADCGRI
jgi:hypothetical protein